MKIKWLAHAAFLITSDSGTRIVTDPYTTDEKFKHGEIHETAELVTASHGHFDHNNIAAVKGNPQVVKETGTYKGIKVSAVAAAHDDEGGSKRGANIIYCFDIDGMRVCHLGDLGHLLTSEQVKAIGKVDVLMIPVGGFFTIDAATADKVIEQLTPKIVLPMHYLTEKMSLPINKVDVFIEGKGNIKRVEGSEIEIKAEQLPAKTEIMVLKPAL